MVALLLYLTQSSDLRNLPTLRKVTLKQRLQTVQIVPTRANNKPNSIAL